MTSIAPLPSGRPHRLVYLGTPAMAVPPLEALVANGFEIALVITRVDKRRSRGPETSPSPVKTCALRLGLPVSHHVADALTVHADLGVVVAFGQLIKEPILQALPMVNLHFSLLPRWRGAAPVERALLAGDATTGVCLMQLELGLDTGPILDLVEVPISADESVGDLRSKLVEVGTRQLVRALTTGLPAGSAQVGEPTYAAKLDPAEFEIDWALPAEHVLRLVRLGVAFTWFHGRRLKILAASVEVGAAVAATWLGDGVVACGSGALRLQRVQPEGKPSMDATAWANGARPAHGETLGRTAERAS